MSSLHEVVGHSAELCRRALTGEHGVALPPFVDHHVHLHLVREEALPAGGIAGVVDLGGDPVTLARRAERSLPRVAYAGAFLTAPGGYPVARVWAPSEVVREVSDASLHPGVAGGAGTSVDEQAAFGASVIKVALNASAGPVFAPDVLHALATAAQSHALPVVAHVEGEGMLRRALDAEVSALAHTPFSAVASDAEIAQAVGLGQVWISTLSIHTGAERELASRNLAAFVAAGGRVLYGTDLGNGDRHPGIQLDELRALDAAGIRGAALIGTLIDPWPLAQPAQGIATFVPGDIPATLDDVPEWLSRATVVPDEELLRDDT